MDQSWIKEFDKLADIFRDADLVDLIAEGAPKDEYDLLALEVFAMVKSRPIGKKGLSSEIVNSISRGFGPGCTVSKVKLQEVIDSIFRDNLVPVPLED